MHEARQVLKKARLRVTNQRLSILEFLMKKKGPVALQLLHKQFSKSVNRITLYRILNNFEDKKVVKLFFAHDGHKYIEFIQSDEVDHGRHNEHLHFQCKTCDKLFCLEDVQVNNLPNGFNLSSAQSVLIGKCDQCD